MCWYGHRWQGYRTPHAQKDTWASMLASVQKITGVTDEWEWYFDTYLSLRQAQSRPLTRHLLKHPGYTRKNAPLRGLVASGTGR